MPTLTQLPTGEDDDEHETKNIRQKKVKDFVGDFNKFFEDLAKRYERDAEKIGNHREYFWRKYPEIFNDSSENGDEMDVDVDATMKTESRPIVDREEKLWKVEEKLLSKRTNERFTNYDGVMSDDSLSRPQKIIHLQKTIGNATRRKILDASLQGELLEECFHQSKKVYEEMLVETKITRRWAQFLQKLHRLSLECNKIIYCTVPLSYIRSNFKIIEEICECNKDRWK